MGIRVSWDDEQKTIIRLDFDTSWTWDDFTAATVEGQAMAKTVGHTVHSLFHMPPGTAIPEGNVLNNLQRMLRIVPPNVGTTVVVSSGMLVTALVNIMARVYRMDKFCTAKSLDEARALIAQYEHAHASPPQPT